MYESEEFQTVDMSVGSNSGRWWGEMSVVNSYRGRSRVGEFFLRKGMNGGGGGGTLPYGVSRRGFT